MKTKIIMLIIAVMTASVLFTGCKSSAGYATNEDRDITKETTAETPEITAETPEVTAETPKITTPEKKEESDKKQPEKKTEKEPEKVAPKEDPEKVLTQAEIDKINEKYKKYEERAMKIYYDYKDRLRDKNKDYPNGKKPDPRDVSDEAIQLIYETEDVGYCRLSKWQSAVPDYASIVHTPWQNKCDIYIYGDIKDFEKKYVGEKKIIKKIENIEENYEFPHYPDKGIKGINGTNFTAVFDGKIDQKTWEYLINDAQFAGIHFIGLVKPM